MIALFGVSAAYHRLPWKAPALRRMRKLDHATIYVGIAGSYTPMTVLILEGAWRWVILGLAWGIACVGVTLSLGFHDKTRAVGSALYGVLGWLIVIAFPQLLRGAGVAALLLLLAGGLLYSVGGILFAFQRPQLRPATFGFHEMWHAFVIGGSLCHWGMTLAVVTR